MDIYDEALEELKSCSSDYEACCDCYLKNTRVYKALERAKKEHKLLELYQTRDGLGLTESDLYAELTKKINKLEEEMKS